MDLEEWELVPDEGFLKIHDDGGKKIYSRKYNHGMNPSVLEKNYFVCPPKSTPQFVETTRNATVPNQLLSIPIHLTPLPPKPHQDYETTTKQVPVKITRVMLSTDQDQDQDQDQDPISQVFFKKMKETEFVDMKVESPKSTTRAGIMPPIDGSGCFSFEDNGEAREPEMTIKNKTTDDSLFLSNGKEDRNAAGPCLDENNGGLNIWKWSLTGIGAICSFGVAAAAATVCIIVFGKSKQQKQNQKLQFHQIYKNDKRIKKVVHHANKLNEAISALRGGPITRSAHVTFGGYYEAR